MAKIHFFQYNDDIVFCVCRAHASTFLFGRSGAAKEATLPSVAKSGETVPAPFIAIVFSRAVGLSATMSGITSHGNCRSPLFREAEGNPWPSQRRPFPLQSLTHARPTCHTFRGEAPDSLVRSVPRAAISPSRNPSPVVRFRSSTSYRHATANAVDERE